MKIGIIGGGSIGLLFAFYLNQYHETVLYVRTAKQQAKLQSEGLILQKNGKTFTGMTDVRLVSEWGKTDEALSIICVKQYQLTNLLENASLTKNHPLLFIQNGMGHLGILERLDSDLIFVGSVEHGSYRINENSFAHTGEGVTRIAAYRGKGDNLLYELLNPLEKTFPFQIEKDYYEMLVKKLIVNAIINPLTAILKVQNGELLNNPFYFQVFNQLFDEIKEILQLRDDKQYYENAIHVCQSTGKNRSSMLKDIEGKRPTEVDAILGYLLEEATKKEIKAPLVNTFYNCIKGFELEGQGN